MERKRKAKERNKENQKAAYLANVENDMAKLPPIEDAIEKIKAELISQLESASSRKKYEAIGNILQWSFSRTVSALEYFKTKTQERSCTSVKDSDYFTNLYVS